jgi:sirohydrochlorin cobaltochelatase
MGFKSTALILSIYIALAACTTATQEPESVPMDHSAHASDLGHVEPDEKGRQLYGMKHEIDAEMLAELRTINVFKGFSDEQIMRAMQHMGSNYTWYASDAGLKEKFGVLIVAHGFGDHGDEVLKNQLGQLAATHPLSFAYGMSMMTSDHIQLGLNDLVEAGATDIVVIPVVSTRHNSLMRQWEYIFRLQKEPEYAQVPQISTSATLNFMPPPDDHFLVGEILLDYASEISQNPQNEEVIIVGHGPVDPEDNLDQLALMENLAGMIRDDIDFAAVRIVSLQDDATRAVRMARIRELREMVAAANVQGRDVLIVTNLLGTRIVQSSLRRALRGLDYRFNAKGLIQHENFIKWINLSVDEAAMLAGQ